MFNGRINITVLFYKIENDKAVVKEIKEFNVDYDQNELKFHNNKMDVKVMIDNELIDSGYDGYYSSQMMNHNNK